MKHSIKGQRDRSNPSVLDLFDLGAKTPPLSTETTDEWETIRTTVKCHFDTVCNGNTHSIQMRLSTDNHFLMNGD